MKRRNQSYIHNSQILVAFVRKEFYHILRDRWTMIILMLMPVVMLVLFGYALNTEVKNAGIAVYDPSDDGVTRALIEKLQVNNYFILKKMLGSPSEIEKTFQEGEIGMVVVFSPHFQQSMQRAQDAQIQIVMDGSDPNTATTLATYATNIFLSYQQYLLKDGMLPYTITPEVKLLYNPSMKASYNFVPGVMGMILILICALMTSVSIAREKENGTMEVLLVSPMKPLYVIISKAIPYFVLSLINLTTILLIAVFVMGVPVSGSIFWLVMLSLLYIFVALAFGLLISSVVRSQIAASLISGVALVLPVMILSGMIFPLENMPVFLRAISQVIPAKWYIVAVKKIMIKGLGFASIYEELCVLSVMAVLLVTIGLRNFKIRLE